MTKSGKSWDAPRIWRRRPRHVVSPAADRAAVPGDATEPAWRRIEMLRERQRLKRQLADIDNEDPEFEDSILQPWRGWRDQAAPAGREARGVDGGKLRDDATAGFDDS